MPKLKAVLAAVTAALTYASHLALPAPYGDLVAAALAAAAYVTNHDALVAAVAKLAQVGLVSLMCVVAFVGCPGVASLPAVNVPTLSQVASVASTLEQAVALAELAGADVAAARKALADKDAYAGVEALRVALDLAAKTGHAVPPEVVALVNTAEGALAAQAVAAGMAAVSR